MKITRSELRRMISEASDEMWAAGQSDYEEQQALMQSDEFHDDYEDDDYYDDYDDRDYERDQAFEEVPANVESFLQQYPDLVDIRGMVEHCLSTGDPNDHNEQMEKIGARLAMMAKRYPEMAEAMLEELQDQ